MKVAEQLGSELFRTRKSPIRFAIWTTLVLLPALILVFPFRSSITVNEMVGSFVLAIVTLYLLLDFLYSRVYVYENGIIHRKLFARTRTVIFNELTQIFVRRWCVGFLKWRFAPHVTIFIDNESHHYKISSNFHRNNDIVDVIQDYIYRHSMHMLNQLFDAGEMLYFGDIQLSRTHLIVHGKSLERKDVGEISIRNGYVRVYEKNGKGGVKRLAFSKSKLSRVANFNMLCRFIEFNDVNVHKFGYHVFKLPFL